MTTTRVAVNGYGGIGKRVADAVLIMPDMELVGVAEVASDWRIRTATGHDITVFAATGETEATMRASGVPVAGRLEDLLGLVDAVVDTAPKGVAATNLNRYPTVGVKAVFQGGESHATIMGHGRGHGGMSMEDRVADMCAPAGRRDELAAAGRTAVLIAVDGKAVGVIALADAAQETAGAAVAAMHEAGIEVVMVTGENEVTAQRIGEQLGIDAVIAEVLPGDKSDKIAEPQRAGRRVAMVGDGVNDAPALATAELGIAIGAGTDAFETADVVFMGLHPLDVPFGLGIGKGAVRKMRQSLGWAIGDNVLALPITAGVFAPASGLALRPKSAALSMSGSSLIVAVKALLLKRLNLPATATATAPAAGDEPVKVLAPVGPTVRELST